ncbi:MAG: YicC family protein [Nitrospirota bacterium]|nr:YicC family protein [Nitrospirota bacterium]
MIRSMTGFGRGDQSGERGGYSVEMRSVNNRYLDVQVKTPRNLGALEPRIRKAVQGSFARGRIDVFVNRTGSDAAAVKLTADHHLAEQYLTIVRELQHRFSLPGEVSVATVLGLPDVISREDSSDDPEALWSMLAPALDQAMERLRTMRSDEGAALAGDIAGRLESIASMTSVVRDRAPETVEQARRRMTETVARILKEQPDPQRIAQEIAILAERTDVTEELTRLDSHLTQFRRLLAGTDGDPVGRKLDFLIQEMGREVNTIASKAMDSHIAMTVVTMKAELEKIREQVQNIE